MLFDTDTTIAQRAALAELQERISHPGTQALAPFPVAIPSSLLTSWAEKACDIAHVLTHLQSAHQPSPVPGVNHLPDCMAIDFAITGAPGDPSLTLIEVQAYPSMFHLSLALEAAYGGTHIGGLSTAERHAIFRHCVAASYSDGDTIMLSKEISPMRTAMDFIVAQSSNDVRPVILSEVYTYRGQWWYRSEQGPRIIKRIYNRIIYHKLNATEKSTLHALMSHPTISWFSDPSWFYRISKASLLALSHPCNPQTRTLTSLLPDDLSKWVLKPRDGHSGQGVRISPTANDIRQANQTQDFLQARVDYLPCIAHPKGKSTPPLTGELRFMVCRDHDTGCWTVVTTLLRTAVDGNISRAIASDNPFEGATVALGV